MEKITRFFWQCSGANTALLEKCPTESSKYVGIGATIFFTGLFAAFAAAYALHTVFDSVWTAIPFGVVWGLMIFNLDRYIVSGMRKEGRGYKQWVMAIPRIILALIISIVIAKPLELKIFEKEVMEELEVMHQEQLMLRDSLVADRFSPEKTKLQLSNKLLQEAILQQSLKRDGLRQMAREEADGTGGTGLRNAGPIYAIKKADADKAESELEQLRKDNEALISQNMQRIAELDSLERATLDSMNQAMADGLASRIDALGRLTAKSQPVQWANIFIMLLFIAVETAPIFVKLISNKGPYDHLIKGEEYPFEVQRIEKLATETDHARTRVTELNPPDKAYANDRLDTALGSS